MDNYRNRPKGNYIQNAEFSDLYNLSQKWKNDLENYLYEIVFLERLVDTYFVKLLLNENIDDLRSLQNEINTSKKECKNILEEINIYSFLILDFISHPNDYATPAFREGYEQFEGEVLTFINAISETRRVVSTMIKEVLEDEKPKYIWKYN